MYNGLKCHNYKNIECSMISTPCLLCNCISTHLSLSPDLAKVMVQQFLTDHCYTQGSHERKKKGIKGSSWKSTTSKLSK